MLRCIHTILSITLFFCFPIANAESATYKCTDGKRITYANQPCEKLELKPAGPIKDGVTVVPAAPKQKKISAENLNAENSNAGSTQPNYQGNDHGDNQNGEERKKETTSENAQKKSVLEKLLN